MARKKIPGLMPDTQRLLDSVRRKLARFEIQMNQCRTTQKSLKRRVHQYVCERNQGDKVIKRKTTRLSPANQRLLNKLLQKMAQFERETKRFRNFHRSTKRWLSQHIQIRHISDGFYFKPIQARPFQGAQVVSFLNENYYTHYTLERVLLIMT